MPTRVYDCRTDIQNLEITPEIRTRFLSIAPREVHQRHSHDLGHEVFLVIEGRLQFIVDDETVELRPGQFCLVRADQMHQLVNATDEPAILYLSVSPHIEPTHSSWSDQGTKLPPRYGGATARERALHEMHGFPTPSVAELAQRQRAAMLVLSEAVTKATEEGLPLLDSLGEAGPPHDREPEGQKPTIDALWGRLYQVFRATSALAAVWNELAVTAAAEPHSAR